MRGHFGSIYFFQHKGETIYSGLFLQVCHVIYKNKRLHTVTNIFIANLSVSDMVITVLNIPFNIMRNLLDHWPFGYVMCILVNFTLMSSVYASTFTMAAIAIDRWIHYILVASSMEDLDILKRKGTQIEALGEPFSSATQFAIGSICVPFLLSISKSSIEEAPKM